VEGLKLNKDFMINKLFIPLSLIILVILFVIAFSLQDDHQAKRDLDIICQTYQWALTQNSMDPHLRESQMAQSILDQIKDPQVIQAFEALQSAEPNQRYELYRVTAQELGYGEWVCGAMGEYMESLVD
jgi:hypothetical protein